MGTRPTAGPSLGEAPWVLQGEGICKGGKWSYTADIAEQFRFRVLALAEIFDLSVIGADLLGERSDGLENGHQGWLERFRDRRCDFGREVICGAGWRLKEKALELGRITATKGCPVILHASEGIARA